jgi:hypothetical protein
MIRLRTAAMDRAPISGLTHRFYRYPARFSPLFARAAIAHFSQPGDVVLDPYMGGGTSIVEATVAGRQGIGSDLNELAVFVTRAKTTVLTPAQRTAVARWADVIVPDLSYWDWHERLEEAVCPKRTHNLTLPRARPIKKLIGLALCDIEALPGPEAQAFARCALLNTGQWALNGRKRTTPLSEFRTRLCATVHEMLLGESAYAAAASATQPARIHQSNAADLATVLDQGSVDLVVTSPPYPGIHMLYHRWQVDGRRETPAPYWIAACNDGQGASFYNFADRRQGAADSYFIESLRTLIGIRSVMKRGAYFVQMIAFSEPETHLPRYLANMEAAGFEEVRLDEEAGLSRHRRIWRSVPGRRWHANLKGDLNSSREVVLVHRAV